MSLLGIIIFFIIAGFFPRFGMYVLGPLILGSVVYFILSGNSDILFSSSGDGWAGLGKLIAWIFLLLIASLGLGIIIFCRSCLKAKEKEKAAKAARNKRLEEFRHIIE